MTTQDPSAVARELDAIARLVESPTGVRDAQTRLSSLLEGLSQEDISRHVVALRATIDRFLPKRRRALNEVLERRIGKVRVLKPVPVTLDPFRLSDELTFTLSNLSDRHIFQWSTSYQAFFSDLYPRIVQSRPSKQILDILFDRFRAHSREIFSKGYEHSTVRLGMPDEVALAKALNGLARFLDLPIGLLTDAARVDGEQMGASRMVTATLIAGILVGFASASFDLRDSEVLALNPSRRGSEVLAHNPRRWAHALAFIDPAGLQKVIGAIDAGDFRTGVETALRPILDAVWDFLEKDGPAHVVAGEFDVNARRILIIIETQDDKGANAQLDVQIFMDTTYATRPYVEGVLRTAPAVLAVPVTANIAHALHGSPLIVDVSDRPGEQREVVQQALRLLREANSRELNPPASEAPPRINYAKQFPLEKANIPQPYLVERESVKSLVDDIRSRHGTGISLWTSVRRSGKTTAARELGRHLADATVVYQTMQTTEQYSERNVLAKEVEAAIKRAEFLEPNFFRSVVTKASDGAATDGRTVVIIDEYERLFQIIRDESKSEHVRLRVCSPLLAQITEFANENLVVLLGMNPLAHYVLMQENQLSAYVRPAHFPLFAHKRSDQDSEFSDLVQKAITRHVQYEPSFVDALYDETRGHPFLSVMALRDMLDWMVNESRPIPRGGLDEATVREYVSSLDRRRLRQSGHFEFFRMFARETLANAPSADLGWLSASMKVLERCADNAGKLTYADALATVRSVADDPPADEVLELAARANLLSLDADTVTPAIPLFARIVAAEAKRV